MKYEHSATFVQRPTVDPNHVRTSTQSVLHNSNGKRND